MSEHSEKEAKVQRGVLSEFSQNRWGDNSQLMSFDDLFNTEYIDQEEDEEGIIELHDYRKYLKSRSLLEEETYPEKILTIDEARKSLKRIGQVGNGLLYGFTESNVENKDLTNIEEIANFKYLSILNLSNNYLDLNALDALRELEYVLILRADHNIIESLCLSPMKYLQILTLNRNRIKSFMGLNQPSLECLELNDNKISHLFQVKNNNEDGDRCNTIDCPDLNRLSLSRNLLDTVEQFSFVSTKLRILYLNYNKIKNLNGLDRLSNLFILNLRGNQLSNLDGFTENLKSLSYLNLRHNNLNDINELKKLTCLKSLKTLVVSQNPFREKQPNVVQWKVLQMIPWLERINKNNNVANMSEAFEGELEEEMMYEDE